MARVGTAIGLNGVHRARQKGVSDQLWREVGPFLSECGRKDLDRILADHRSARAQEWVTPTPAEENASVQNIMTALERLGPDDRLGRALVDAKIRDLGGEAGFTVHIALVRIAPRRRGREATDIEAFDADELREALSSGFTVANGPRKDTELRQTVLRLIRLYRFCSGKKFTHSNRKNALYEQAPQSAAGRFVLACIRAVDRHTQDSAVSAALAECQREMRRPYRLSELSKL